MAIDFPNSPVNGDTFTASGKTWVYAGTVWNITSGTNSVADGAITNAKLAANAVHNVNIAEGAVHSVNIAAGEVTATKLASGAAVSNIGYTPANTASPTFTGAVVLPSTTSVGDVTGTQLGYLAGVTSMVQTQLNAKAPAASPTFTGTVSGVTKSMVGLGSVDNTADTAKPVSTAQQTALNLKANLASPLFTGKTTSQGGALGSTVNSKIDCFEAYATSTNGEQLVTKLHKVVAGGDWTNNAWMIQRRVDVTDMGFVKFGVFDIRLGYGLTDTFVLLSDGNLTITGGTATKASGTAWANPSDERIKDNVRDYEKGTTELMQVRVREWEYNGKGGTVEGTKGLGVVADEVVLVLPNTVDTYAAKLEADDEENTDIKRFDATEITWLLVKTAQEQQAVIESQQATIQSLTVRIEALEA